MKPLLLLTASMLALASAGASAQVSPTDRLAVSSGVSLWQSAWKSAGKADLAKLQPLYGKNVLTRTAAATDQVKRTWVEFANVVRDRGSTRTRKRGRDHGDDRRLGGGYCGSVHRNSDANTNGRGHEEDADVSATRSLTMRRLR